MRLLWLNAMAISILPSVPLYLRSYDVALIHAAREFVTKTCLSNYNGIWNIVNIVFRVTSVIMDLKDYVP
jgi:uncharacterized membrane protein